MKPGGEVQVSDSVSLAHKEWCGGYSFNVWRNETMCARGSEQRLKKKNHPDSGLDFSKISWQNYYIYYLFKVIYLWIHTISTSQDQLECVNYFIINFWILNKQVIIPENVLLSQHKKIYELNFHIWLPNLGALFY